MKQAKEDGRQLYIAFLDVQKAYDKAWLDTILYTLWNAGVRGKIWRILLTKYKHDIKKTWKVLNTIIGRTNDKTSIPDNFIIYGSPTDDKNKIAEEFCNYLSNVGQKLAANIPNVGIDPLSYLTKEKSVMNSIYLNPTSPEEIFKVIRTIKPGRSCGPDNISNELLKQINSAICTPISCLINKSLETGTVPTFCESHTCIQV